MSETANESSANKPASKAYRNAAPKAIEIVGSCEACGDGVLICAARGEGWAFVKCLYCGDQWSVADTESGVSDSVVSAATPGGSSSTAGLPGGASITVPA